MCCLTESSNPTTRIVVQGSSTILLIDCRLSKFNRLLDKKYRTNNQCSIATCTSEKSPVHFSYARTLIQSRAHHTKHLVHEINYRKRNYYMISWGFCRGSLWGLDFIPKYITGLFQAKVIVSGCQRNLFNGINKFTHFHQKMTFQHQKI